MGKVDGHTISGSVKLADNTSRAIADTRERKQAIDESDKVELNKLVETIGSLSDEPSQKFENVFNIHGNNPKEIAEEVSKIIQRQVERKGASWA